MMRALGDWRGKESIAAGSYLADSADAVLEVVVAGVVLLVTNDGYGHVPNDPGTVHLNGIKMFAIEHEFDHILSRLLEKVKEHKQRPMNKPRPLLQLLQVRHRLIVDRFP